MASVLSSFGRAAEPTAPVDKGGLPVRVQRAEPVDSFLRERVYTGTLVASRRSVLSFQTGGQLLEVSVDEGDAVQRDQPLATLDTRRLRAQESQAKADLQRATAQLRELIAGPRKQTIAAAQAELKNLEALRDVAAIRLRRRDSLVKTKAISQEEYDEALYAHQAAIARAQSAAETLAELQAGTRQEQIDAQRSQVEALEARLADIRHELDDAVLLAPFDGVIAQRRLDEGTVVTIGQPVFDLIESSSLEAWIGAPPTSARNLQVGAELQVTIQGDSKIAQVQSIRPELDPETRTQNVVLRLANPQGLVAGQVARVGVREPVQMNGYWVPTSSLTPDRRGLWAVYVADENNLVAARPVELIENDGERSFVRGALTAGEQVIVAGAHRVVPGQRVKPIAADQSLANK